MGTFVTNPTDEVVFTHSAKDDSETQTIQVWLPDKATHPLQGQMVCIALTGFSGAETTPPPTETTAATNTAKTGGGEAGLIGLSAVSAVVASQDDKGKSGVEGCAIETKLPVVDKGSPLTLRLTWKANDAKMQLGTYLGQITAKHGDSEYVVLPVRVVVVAPPTPTPTPPPTPTPAPTDAAAAGATPSPTN